MSSWALFLLVALNCVLFSDAGIPVKTKTIVNVGGSGSYDEIVGMPCGGGIPQCNRQPKFVSGCLAPFDEEQTLKLRGPMEVMEIGVYYPTGADWNRVSYFNQAGSMDNIVAMGNYGRSMDGHDVDESSCHTMPGEQASYIVNGDDFMCNGYNTTYASEDGKCASKTMRQFSGRLDDTVEVNFMQQSTCDSGGCGFYRGMGQRGWDGVGGSKMFAVKLKYTYGSIHNSPAVWFLHASVLRTANYLGVMCNCRGMGSPGGCGELDIAEVVTEQNRKDDLDTTIYSFKGSSGDQYAYKFERPYEQEIVYVTIFNSEGYIQILQLDSSEFSFDASISNAVVDALNSKRDLIIKMPGETPAGCGGPQCSYMSSQSGGFTARVQDGVVCDDTPTSSESVPATYGFDGASKSGLDSSGDRFSMGGFSTDSTDTGEYPGVTTYPLPAKTGCIPVTSGLPDSNGEYQTGCDDSSTNETPYSGLSSSGNDYTETLSNDGGYSGSTSTGSDYTLANGGYSPGRRLKSFS